MHLLYALALYESLNVECQKVIQPERKYLRQNYHYNNDCCT